MLLTLMSNLGMFGPRGAGGIDAPKRRTIYKPTGLLDRKIERRISEAAQESAEITAKLDAEFLPEVIAAAAPVQRLTLEQIDFEIGLLLRNKMRTDEEDALLVILLVANV